MRVISGPFSESMRYRNAIRACPFFTANGRIRLPGGLGTASGGEPRFGTVHPSASPCSGGIRGACFATEHSLHVPNPVGWVSPRGSQNGQQPDDEESSGHDE